MAKSKAKNEEQKVLDETASASDAQATEEPSEPVEVVEKVYTTGKTEEEFVAAVEAEYRAKSNLPPIYAPEPPTPAAPETDVERIARICHEVNRAYCAQIGDHSQRPWDLSPEWQKQSAIKGVEFHKANPHAEPRASHDSWLRQKNLEGWSYGLTKDEAKKEHPCFVSFDQLPKEQQAKDYLFGAIVKALA